ncbi:MAG: efflux RND transporter periplasmic adaptor subunit [Bacteroidetes bacterium]|nr:efflux RND transporter periplasmic adaptor subunit [Bacteroidota bacterium]
MKFSKTFIVILFLVTILVVIKLVFLKNDNAKNNTPAFSKNPAVLANAMIAGTQKLENKVFTSGNVLANEEVELKPEASGKILRINFKEGSKVEKNDLLIQINDADLQAQLKKLGLQMKLASEQEQRQKKLLDINGISQEEYDISLNHLNTLKADEEFTKALLAKTELRAPFNGIIGLKDVSEGSYVSPSQSIAWLQQIDPVKIDFSVPEKYGALVRKGDKIIFTTAGLKDTLHGEVYAIQPRIDMATRTLQVRALSPNKEGKIIPGSFVKVELVLKEFNDAIMLPTEAIVPVLKGKNVFVYRNGKAEAQKIQTGIRTDAQIQVVDGVQPGDTIITTGLMQLRAGMAVTLSNIK